MSELFEIIMILSFGASWPLGYKSGIWIPAKNRPISKNQ